MLHKVEYALQFLFTTRSLTNLEELSFLMVLALPKASNAGLAWIIWSSSVPYKQIKNPEEGKNIVKTLGIKGFVSKSIFVPFLK